MNVTETNDGGSAPPVEGGRRRRRARAAPVGAPRRAQGPGPDQGLPPGHVPKAHLRKVYGRSVMAEVVQQAVAETSREAITQREERPAFQPNIAFPRTRRDRQDLLRQRATSPTRMSFEVLPKFDAMDFGKIALERPVAAVDRRRHGQGARPAARRQSVATRRKTVRPQTATASRSTSSARSTASRSRAARPRMHRSCSAAAISFRASRKA